MNKNFFKRDGLFPCGRPVLAAVLLILVAACEDPSNVGLGLIGEEGGDPERTVVAPSTFTEQPIRRPARTAPRILAGEVDDALLGTVRATGFVDFAVPTSVRESFRQGTVRTAVLKLFPTYVYGDTTNAVRFGIRESQSEWQSQQMTSVDTTIAAGEIIHEFSFNPTDSVVTVELPNNWVMEKDEVLRSTSFNDEFHGFQLVQIDGNAIVGFHQTSSDLVARTDADSVRYTVAKTYSAMSRLSSADLPAGRLAMQAEVGPQVLFRLNLEEELAGAALNRVVINLPTDTLLVSGQKPSGFHRPTIGRLVLIGIEADDSRVPIEIALRDSEGRFRFQSSALRSVLQQEVLGEQRFSHFQIELPADESATVNPLILFDLDAGEDAPRAIFTVTPISD